MEHSVMQLRSWMFVPGHRQRMIDKSLGLEALDAVLLDIEDGVAPAEKDTARRQIGEALDQLQDQKTASGRPVRTPVRYVRINAVGHERMQADLAEIVRPTLEGLVLPKIENPKQVRFVAEILDRRESQMGLPIDSIKLLLAIESPRGLMNAYELAASSPRVIGLMFGAEDFGKELGLPFQREGEARDLLYARSAMVTAAAAANVQAVDGVWPNLEDTDGLKTFALQSRRLGFTGMSLIHPSQVDAVNAAFTPTPEETEYCRKVVAAYEEAEQRGEGAIAFGGQLLDRPIVERARRTLALAEAHRLFRK
jgi:citrate lyase subunit beta / citryl-CoA lyase